MPRLTLTVALGTRPEVIKLAPVVVALRSAGHALRVVATGQHSDPRLSTDLFDALGAAPDAVWSLPGDEGDRVGALLANAFHDLRDHRPDAVVVLGDTYTAPLVAMAARRAGVGVVHVEAGLRSFNQRSMEESNRRMVAALATVHLAPTEMAAGFLRAEGIAEPRIRVVGNPVVDAARMAGARRRPLAQRRGLLMTAHRATNVDDPDRLAELVAVVRRLAAAHGPVVFPVHPRTRDRLTVHGWWDDLRTVSGLQLLDPLPYPDLLARLAGSQAVVTDSGGLQEEAAYLGVPVVVMRTTTPRWEGVAAGAAVLAGLDRARVLDAVGALLDPAERDRIDRLPCPYGDGDSAARIAAAVGDPELQELLRPRDPEPADAPPQPVGAAR